MTAEEARFRPWALLGAHLGPWGVFFALEAALPFTSLAGSAGAARFWCVVYVGLSTVAAWLFVRMWPPGRPPAPSPQYSRAGGLALGCAVAGVVGLLLQGYDKIQVQGIDYTSGFALARYAWAEASASRGGAISSVPSALGNLLAPFFVLALALALVRWESLRPRTRWTVLGLSAVTLAGTSVLTGGRSVLLVVLGVGVAACLVRYANGLYLIPGARGGAAVRTALTFLLAAGLALVWFAYVFAQRANANDLDIKYYVDILLPRLNAAPTAAYDAIAGWGGTGSSIGYLLTAVGVYAVHGLYTFQLALADLAHPGSFLAAYPGLLAHKLGLLSQPPAPFTYHGLFLPLPGAVFYDFGWGGLLIGALGHGLLLGTVIVQMRDGRGGLLMLGIGLGVLATSVVAPITVSFNLLIFPFVGASFVATHAACRLWYGRRPWRSI